MFWFTKVIMMFLTQLLLGRIGAAALYTPFEETSKTAIEPLSFFIILLHKICWILGGAFVMGAFIQYLQHRQNGSQVPISRPILLAIIGTLLFGLSYLKIKL